ncbi:nucleolus protein [Ceraceosorus bombacis]|uniref:Nucleolus protein n=1 Tax=Ceraceosorus bombacis TaxID=401625 RepID=A0A0P1BDG0_9BASI|nr:nucleolus protein [Ceraceosorus bombacis]
MVSFNCEGCFDVIKKPKLDAHHQRCKAPFTCLDCSTVFNSPQAWKPHTTCISEAEKYERSVYKGNANGKGKGKGKPQPQEQEQRKQGMNPAVIAPEKSGDAPAQADAQPASRAKGSDSTAEPASEVAAASKTTKSPKSKKRKESDSREEVGAEQTADRTKKSKKDKSTESAEEKAARRAAKALSKEAERSGDQLQATSIANARVADEAPTSATARVEAKESKEDKKARKEEKRKRKEEKDAKRANKAHTAQALGEQAGPFANEARVEERSTPGSAILRSLPARPTPGLSSRTDAPPRRLIAVAPSTASASLAPLPAVPSLVAGLSGGSITRISGGRQKQRLVGSASKKNTKWSLNESLPGHKLLSSMGWKAGQGIGSLIEGRQRGPVADSVMLKLDKGGIGAMRAQREAKQGGDEWIASNPAAANDLGDLFARLNQHTFGIQQQQQQLEHEHREAQDKVGGQVKKRKRDETKEERKERKQAEKIAKKAFKKAEKADAACARNSTVEAEGREQMKKNLPIRGAGRREGANEEEPSNSRSLKSKVPARKENGGARPDQRE